MEAWADRFDDRPYPGEGHLIAGAVEARRQEFMTARRCARRALSILGCGEVAIGSGRRREPLWPRGVVGSITHCLGYRAAVVASAEEVASVGIDAEPNGPLPDDVIPLVMRPFESRRARELISEGIVADRLVFSAKEAVYKAWYPVTGRWLDFLDVELDFDASESSFQATILADVPERNLRHLFANLSGSFTLETNTLITGVITGSP